METNWSLYVSKRVTITTISLTSFCTHVEHYEPLCFVVTETVYTIQVGKKIKRKIVRTSYVTSKTTVKRTWRNLKEYVWYEQICKREKM